MAQVSYGTITITDTNDINRIYVEYCRSTSNQLSGSTVPGITVNWSESTPAWVDGQYLWQRAVIEKSGTLEKTYGTPVCITGAQGETGSQGSTGAAGRSLTSTTTQYTTAATNATITQSNMGNYTWSSNVPTYNSSTPAYWVRITNVYSNPSSTEYIIYKDNGITDAVKTSHDANTTASAANTTANSANTTANNANTKADNAVTSVNNLQNKLKYYWVNEVAHTNGVSGWTKPNYPAGTYAASGISGTTFDAENSSTYGYNTWYANGINLRYNAIKLGELTGSALTFYQPSTTSQGAKAMELSGSALKFYASNGTTVQAEFGGSKARVSGTINAYDGQIGNSEDNYWYIGNYLDYFENQSAIIKSHGTASIQLGDSNTWRIATNRIHTAWNNDSSSGDAFKLHFPVYNNKYWDSGLHLPTSANDKLLYIRNSSSSNTLTYLNEALEDQYTNRWNYLFYITNSGSIYAKNIYVLDDNGQATQIGGTDGVYLLKSGGTITGDLTVNGTLTGTLSGTATRVSKDLKIQLNGGTTEGTNQFTYNGGTAKTINITKSSVGLSNVENTALSTWAGSSNLTTTKVGTLAAAAVKGVDTSITASSTSTNLPTSKAVADLIRGYLPLTGGNVTGAVTFGSSVSADELTAGDLVVNGNASFTNNLQANTINGVAVGNSPKFTDVNVTQTATTTSAAYEVLFSYTADNTTRTEGARKTSTFTYNPNTKELTIGTVKIKEASTGFTISGGTTSKTLTVGGDYTLAAAAAKGVVTSIDTSANLPTSNAVKTFVEGKGYITANHTSTYTLPLAASGTRGGVQIGYTQSGKNYPVQLSSEKMYVNVPWENTWTAMTGATSSADGAVGYIGTTPPKSGYNTKYWRADGTWSTPPNDNTHRPIQLDSTEILGNNTTALNLITGGGMALSNSSGSVTIAHKDTSSQATSTNSGRTYIQSITLDTYGHVTSLSTATESVTDTHYTTHLYAGKSDGNVNAATTNGNTYLMVLDNTTVRDRRKISGSGAAEVTSDSSGNITISSPIAITGVSFANGTITFTKSDSTTIPITTDNFVITQATGATALVRLKANSTTEYEGYSAGGATTAPVYFDSNGHPVAVTSIPASLISGSVNPTSHNHSQIVTVGDQRSTATVPNDYVNALIFKGLKNKATIGSPSSDSYSYLIGLRGWSDSSGGRSHEIAFNNTGIFVRQESSSTANTWGSWYQIYTTGNKPTKSDVGLGNVANSDTTNASNITSGTLTKERLATSGATAGSYGDSGNQTPGYGSTFKVPYITVDTYGRVTSISEHTVKIPASDNSNYYHTTGSWSGTTYTATANGGAGELKFTLPTASASASGIVNTSAQVIAGKKTIKYTTRIYPMVGASNEKSQWYKITFPYYNAETTSAAKWFMNSFDLHFGGGYSANASGIAHVAFYWTRAANNGAWAASQVAAKLDGILMNKITLYYRIAEPGVLYVNNSSNNYNGIWLDNLYVDDTSPNLDWSTTIIETCSAITVANYTEVPTVRTYNNNSSTYIIGNHTLPMSNNTYNLGSSDNKWANIYATTFSGALSGNASTASKITNITSSDNASSTADWRKVWISYADGVTGRPAVTDGLTFQTSTNTLKAPHFLAEHISGGQNEFRITYGSTVDMAMMIGAGNENHGLYDNKAGKWMIVSDINGNVTVNGNATNVTGTVAVNHGGTGTTSFTANSLIMSGSSTTGAFTTRGIRNNTAAGSLGWTSQANDNVIPTVNTLAYWNGRYNDSTSNLAYCNKGAFGTAATYTAATSVGNNSNLPTGAAVQTYVSGVVGSYVTLGTDQTITANQKTFNGAIRWGTASKYGAAHYDSTLEAIVFSFA